MKILLLTTHLNIGGIGTYTVALAKALKSKGEEVFVASSGGVLVPELTAGGVSHIKVNIATKSEVSTKVLRSIFQTYKIVKSLGIDIIHAQTRVSQVVGEVVSILSGSGFVTTSHGFFRNNIGRRLFPAWGKSVIAISEPVREHLIKDFQIDKDRISLIYNGIDVKKYLKEFSKNEKDKLKKAFGIKPNNTVLGTVSRFTPDKGHDVLLYAFYEILKKRPDTQLVFVGDGKEKAKVIDLCQRLNLSEKVVFIKPQLNTVNVLSVIDVFMFTPRRREGLGIVLLEALASGKAVVATKVGGIPSVIENGVNGFLVSPSSPEALIEPIERLLEDRALYHKMAQAGREIVIQKFSINGMADRVHALYNKVLEENSGKK